MLWSFAAENDDAASAFEVYEDGSKTSPGYIKLNELPGVALVIEEIDGNSDSTTTSSSSGHKLSMDETSLYKHIVAK